jgi:hypothetical protein
VTSRRYVPRLASASGGERRALKRQMGLFRAQVVDPVNRALERQEKAGDVHNPCTVPKGQNA